MPNAAVHVAAPMPAPAGPPPYPAAPAVLFAAFDEAVGQGDLELAAVALRLAEAALLLRAGPSPAPPCDVEALVVRHRLLWALRHSGG